MKVYVLVNGGQVIAVEATLLNAKAKARADVYLCSPNDDPAAMVWEHKPYRNQPERYVGRIPGRKDTYIVTEWEV